MGAEALQQLPGLVIALEANFCRVQLEQPGPSGVAQLLCVRRTRLGKTGQQICVGDRVQVEGVDWLERRAAVAAVAPRHSLLERPAVANCSRVVVVVALAQPALDPLQLTRFLLTAERTGVAVDLVLTKADLLTPDQRLAWQQRFAAWGYAPLLVSAQRGEGMEALRQRLSQPGIAVLCGPSGVGKSSLINALVPQLVLRVGSVSGRLQRGRHTTRHVELYPLAEGALLADTPGFNRPDLPEEPAELARLFPEIRARLEGAACRFKNCLHQGDPGCAVGEVWERYPLYISCLDTLLAQVERERGRQRSSEVAGLKQRGGRPEPQLAQRLRQPSRKLRRQSDPAEE
jgi:ribosome biogenesis GTPase